MIHGVSTILLVDDDPDYARLVCRWLQGAGHGVEAVESPFGISARLLEDPPVDVVVLDFMMPALTGTAVLQLVGSHPRLRDIPVLFMSAAPHPSLVEAARLHGRALFLEKSGRRAALLDAIEGLLKTPSPPASSSPSSSRR
jgi:CheY-like chemotaxis protein